MRKPILLVALVAVLFVASCAADSTRRNIPKPLPQPPYVDKYQGLAGEGDEGPWQGGAERFEAPPTGSDTDAPGGSQSASGEALGQAGREWRGHFFLKELMPVVDPETVGKRLVYMGADPRIYRSEMEPSLKGGVTKTRVAVRSEKEGSGWLMLIDQDPAYRMYQIITRDAILRALSWAGAEHILLGTVSFAGFTFDSDSSFPLHFKLVQDVGYVHLCGRGAVTTPDGREYTLGQHQTVDDFLPGLESEGQLSREAAAEALGWLVRTKGEINAAVPALIKALQDSAMEVRRNAAWALGKIGDSRAREALEEALRDEDEWVREVVADALKKLENV